MAFVPCLCTSCGAPLEVDDTKEAAICRFCGTPFIVEKAINNYKTVNITMEAKDENALIRKGQRLLLSIYYDKDELAKIGEDLSDISTNDFYPEFFLFASDRKDNKEWLLKNADASGKKELALFLFNRITRDYNKEKFEDIHLNIEKNYEGVNFDAWENDKTCSSVYMLDKLQDVFDEDMKKKWDSLKKMAEEELGEMALQLNSCRSAITALGYVKTFPSIVSPSTASMIEDKVKAFASHATSDDFKDLLTLAKMTGDENIFRAKITDDLTLTMNKFIYKGREYPSAYALCYATGEDYTYVLLQLDDSSATVIRLSTAKFDYRYQMLLPNMTTGSISFFEGLTGYRSESISGYSLRLVYREGISYKETVGKKLFGFFSSFLK